MWGCEGESRRALRMAGPMRELAPMSAMRWICISCGGIERIVFGRKQDGWWVSETVGEGMHTPR